MAKRNSFLKAVGSTTQAKLSVMSRGAAAQSVAKPQDALWTDQRMPNQKKEFPSNRFVHVAGQGLQLNPWSAAWERKKLAQQQEQQYRDQAQQFANYQAGLQDVQAANAQRMQDVQNMGEEINTSQWGMQQGAGMQQPPINTPSSTMTNWKQNTPEGQAFAAQEAAYAKVTQLTSAAQQEQMLNAGLAQDKRNYTATIELMNFVGLEVDAFNVGKVDLFGYSGLGDVSNAGLDLTQFGDLIDTAPLAQQYPMVYDRYDLLRGILGTALIQALNANMPPEAEQKLIPLAWDTAYQGGEGARSWTDAISYSDAEEADVITQAAQLALTETEKNYIASLTKVIPNDVLGLSTIQSNEAFNQMQQTAGAASKLLEIAEAKKDSTDPLGLGIQRVNDQLQEERDIANAISAEAEFLQRTSGNPDKILASMHNPIEWIKASLDVVGAFTNFIPRWVSVTVAFPILMGWTNGREQHGPNADKLPGVLGPGVPGAANVWSPVYWGGDAFKEMFPKSTYAAKVVEQPNEQGVMVKGIYAITEDGVREFVPLDQLDRWDVEHGPEYSHLYNLYPEDLRYAEMWDFVTRPDGSIRYDRLLGEWHLGKPLSDYLGMGTISWSLIKHPERIKPFMEAVDAGRDPDYVAHSLQDVWLEFRAQILTDPIGMLDNSLDLLRIGRWVGKTAFDVRNVSKWVKVAEEGEEGYDILKAGSAALKKDTEDLDRMLDAVAKNDNWVDAAGNVVKGKEVIGTKLPIPLSNAAQKAISYGAKYGALEGELASSYDEIKKLVASINRGLSKGSAANKFQLEKLRKAVHRAQAMLGDGVSLKTRNLDKITALAEAERAAGKTANSLNQQKLKKLHEGMLRHTRSVEDIDEMRMMHFDKDSVMGQMAKFYYGSNDIDWYQAYIMYTNPLLAIGVGLIQKGSKRFLGGRAATYFASRDVFRAKTTWQGSFKTAEGALKKPLGLAMSAADGTRFWLTRMFRLSKQAHHAQYVDAVRTLFMNLVIAANKKSPLPADIVRHLNDILAAVSAAGPDVAKWGDEFPELRAFSGLGIDSRNQLRDVVRLIQKDAPLKLGEESVGLDVYELLGRYGPYAKLSKADLIEYVESWSGSQISEGITRAVSDMYARVLFGDSINQPFFRFFSITGQILKENVLALSLAFMTNNYMDNMTKTILAGYMPSAGLTSADRAARLIEGLYDISVPSAVVRNQIADLIDFGGEHFQGLATSRYLPWPLGESWGILFWARGKKAPAWATRELRFEPSDNGLVEFMHKWNYARLMSKGLDLSHHIEVAARMNIFEQAFQADMLLRVPKLLGKRLRNYAPREERVARLVETIGHDALVNDALEFVIQDVSENGWETSRSLGILTDRYAAITQTSTIQYDPALFKPVTQDEHIKTLLSSFNDTQLTEFMVDVNPHYHQMYSELQAEGVVAELADLVENDPSMLLAETMEQWFTNKFGEYEDRPFAKASLDDLRPEGWGDLLKTDDRLAPIIQRLRTRILALQSQWASFHGTSQEVTTDMILEKILAAFDATSEEMQDWYLKLVADYRRANTQPPEIRMRDLYNFRASLRVPQGSDRYTAVYVSDEIVDDDKLCFLLSNRRVVPIAFTADGEWEWGLTVEEAVQRLEAKVGNTGEAGWTFGRGEMQGVSYGRFDPNTVQKWRIHVTTDGVLREGEVNLSHRLGLVVSAEGPQPAYVFAGGQVVPMGRTFDQREWKKEVIAGGTTLSLEDWIEEKRVANERALETVLGREYRDTHAVTPEVSQQIKDSGYFPKDPSYSLKLRLDKAMIYDEEAYAEYAARIESEELAAKRAIDSYRAVEKALQEKPDLDQMMTEAASVKWDATVAPDQASGDAATNLRWSQDHPDYTGQPRGHYVRKAGDPPLRSILTEADLKAIRAEYVRKMELWNEGFNTAADKLLDYRNQVFEGRPPAPDIEAPMEEWRKWQKDTLSWFDRAVKTQIPASAGRVKVKPENQGLVKLAGDTHRNELNYLEAEGVVYSPTELGKDVRATYDGVEGQKAVVDPKKPRRRLPANIRNRVLTPEEYYKLENFLIDLNSSARSRAYKQQVEEQALILLGQIDGHGYVFADYVPDTGWSFGVENYNAKDNHLRVIFGRVGGHTEAYVWGATEENKALLGHLATAGLDGNIHVQFRGGGVTESGRVRLGQLQPKEAAIDTQTFRAADGKLFVVIAIPNGVAVGDPSLTSFAENWKLQGYEPVFSSGQGSWLWSMEDFSAGKPGTPHRVSSMDVPGIESAPGERQALERITNQRMEPAEQVAPGVFIIKPFGGAGPRIDTALDPKNVSRVDKEAISKGMAASGVMDEATWTANEAYLGSAISTAFPNGYINGLDATRGFTVRSAAAAPEEFLDGVLEAYPARSKAVATKVLRGVIKGGEVNGEPIPYRFRGNDYIGQFLKSRGANINPASTYVINMSSPIFKKLSAKDLIDFSRHCLDYDLGSAFALRGMYTKENGWRFFLFDDDPIAKDYLAESLKGHNIGEGGLPTFKDGEIRTVLDVKQPLGKPALPALRGKNLNMELLFPGAFTPATAAEMGYLVDQAKLLRDAANDLSPVFDAKRGINIKYLRDTSPAEGVRVDRFPGSEPWQFSTTPYKHNFSSTTSTEYKMLMRYIDDVEAGKLMVYDGGMVLTRQRKGSFHKVSEKQVSLREERGNFMVDLKLGRVIGTNFSYDLHGDDKKQLRNNYDLFRLWLSGNMRPADSQAEATLWKRFSTLYGSGDVEIPEVERVDAYIESDDLIFFDQTSFYGGDKPDGTPIMKPAIVVRTTNPQKAHELLPYLKLQGDLGEIDIYIRGPGANREYTRLGTLQEMVTNSVPGTNDGIVKLTQERVDLSQLFDALDINMATKPAGYKFVVGSHNADGEMTMFATDLQREARYSLKRAALDNGDTFLMYGELVDGKTVVLHLSDNASWEDVREWAYIVRTKAVLKGRDPTQMMVQVHDPKGGIPPEASVSPRNLTVSIYNLAELTYEKGLARLADADRIQLKMMRDAELQESVLEPWMQYLGNWRKNISESVGDPRYAEVDKLPHEEYIKKRRQMNNAQFVAATEIEAAAKRATTKVNEVLFDYSERSNVEELVRAYSPFSTWQLRNPMWWAQTLAKKPSILGAAIRYTHAANARNEQLNLPERFGKRDASLVDMPTANPLDMLGLWKPGMPWTAIRPSMFMSLAGQMRTPYEPYGSEEFYERQDWLRRGMRVAMQSGEALGIAPWPVIRGAAVGAGILPNEYEETTAESVQLHTPVLAGARTDEVNLDKVTAMGPKTLPNYESDIDRFINEAGEAIKPALKESITLGPIQRAAETIAQLAGWMQPGKKFVSNKLSTAKLYDYYTKRAIPEMLAEGVITEEQALEARQTEQGPAWEMAQERVQKLQGWKSFLSLTPLSSLNPTVATAGEMKILHEIDIVNEADAEGGYTAYQAAMDRYPEVRLYNDLYTSDIDQKMNDIIQKYEPTLKKYMPWEDEFEKAIVQRSQEMDALFLGDKPKMEQYVNYIKDPLTKGVDKEVVLLGRLRSQEPRAGEYITTDEATGEIQYDGDKFYADQEKFFNNIESLSTKFGWAVDLPTYLKYRYANFTVQGVAYDLFKKERTQRRSFWEDRQPGAPGRPPGAEFDEVVEWAATQQYVVDMAAGFTPTEAELRKGENMLQWQLSDIPSYWSKKYWGDYLTKEKSLGDFSTEVANILGIEIPLDRKFLKDTLSQVSMPSMVNQKENMTRADFEKNWLYNYYGNLRPDEKKIVERFLESRAPYFDEDTTDSLPAPALWDFKNMTPSQLNIIYCTLQRGLGDDYGRTICQLYDADIHPEYDVPPNDPLTQDEKILIVKAQKEYADWKERQLKNPWEPWTPLMEQMYGDPNSYRSQWRAWVDNHYISSEGWNDGTIGDLLKGTSVAINADYSKPGEEVNAEEIYRRALEYVNYPSIAGSGLTVGDTLCDPVKTRQILEHPEWIAMAKIQRQDATDWYDARLALLEADYDDRLPYAQYENRDREDMQDQAQWRHEHPELWIQLGRYKALQKAYSLQHPYAMWVYHPSWYKIFWGDVTPDKITTDQAEKEMRYWLGQIDRYFAPESLRNGGWNSFLRQFMGNSYYTDLTGWGTPEAPVEGGRQVPTSTVPPEPAPPPGPPPGP